MVASTPPQTVDNLVDLLRWRAEVSPTGRGFRYLENGEGRGQLLEFADLDRRARAIAARLNDEVEVGDRVALLYRPGLEFLGAFFGCLYAGVIAVPAYPPNPRQLQRTLPRLLSILRDCGAALALSSADLVAMGKPLAAQSERLEQLRWLATDSIDNEEAAHWQPPKVGPETVAFLQYTSGSTGQPKGVVLEHQTLMRNEALLREAFAPAPESVAVTWLPLYHDMGLIGAVIQPVYSGFTSVLMSPLDFLKRPARWVEAMSRFEATSSTAPNFGYDLAVRKTPVEVRDELDLSSWKVAGNGAEPIRVETLDRFAAYFEPVGFDKRSFMPAYGLAEVGLIVSAAPRGKGPRTVEVEGRAKIACGRPAGDFDLRIVRPGTRRPTPDGEVGEIWIRGGSVAAGYWNKDRVNQKVFQAHLASGEGPFLRSGDLGVIDDGEVVITGRLKDLIVIRGVNHYPQDIESSVESVDPAIRPGCGAAFSVDDEQGREALVVVQEIRPSKVEDLDDLVRRIRETITTVHRVVPREVVLIEPGTIEKTSSGKLQRFAARQSYEDGTLSVLARTGREHRDSKTDASREASQSVVESWLVTQVASEAGVEESAIDLDAPFAAYGVDSAQAVGIVGELEQWLEVEVSATALYDFPTIAALAAHLSDSGAPQEGDDDRDERSSPSTRVTSGGSPSESAEALAIVGMGCRFPKADTLEAYWSQLQSGQEAIEEVPSWRWEPGVFTDPEVAGLDTMTTDRGGFVEGIETFDPEFFGLSAREAQAMDPQQRLVLETGWRALEDAGWSRDQLKGSRTGVFIGQSGSDFARLYQGSPVRAGSGMAPSITANRLSYWLDLRGPSVVVDTACSSSLVALDQAMMNLRAHRCEAALVGGVNAILAPDMSVAFSQARMLSPTGQCRSFDADANGYVRGEGCGVMAIKRLADAERDGDRVRAIIRGGAVNQDGASNGLTAPRGQAQIEVIEAALRDAGLEASAIGAIEAHGTGTELGDAIEARALSQVFCDRDRPCWVGSVKSQIGHLEAAAGMAGLIKAALMTERATVMGQVNFERLNPNCELEDTPLVIPRQTQDWASEPNRERPRRVGVSSFGFGGTNAHFIVEQPAQQSSVQRSHARFERRRLWPDESAMRKIKPGPATS